MFSKNFNNSSRTFFASSDFSRCSPSYSSALIEWHKILFLLSMLSMAFLNFCLSFSNLLQSRRCTGVSLQLQARGVLKDAWFGLSYLRYKNFLFGITLLLHDVVALAFLSQLVVWIIHSQGHELVLILMYKESGKELPFGQIQVLLHGFSYKLSVPTQYSHTLTLNVCKICRVGLLSSD